jgi:hypothetical protein
MKVLNDWFNKWFFVKEKTPAAIIGLGSAAIGVTVYIFVDMCYGRAADAFVVRVAFKILGILAAIAIAVILLLSVSGIYNLCKWLIGKRTKKGVT